MIGKHESEDDLLDAYNCGRCMYLAAALSQRFGWEIQAYIVEDAPQGEWIDHAWVVNHEGMVVDINGVYEQSRNASVNDGTLRKNLAISDLQQLTGHLPHNHDSRWEQEIADANTVIEQYLIPRHLQNTPPSHNTQTEPEEKYGREHIKAARDIGGMSLREAVNALDTCQGDVLLAVGYAQTTGLAVKIGDGSEEARHDWAMRRAQYFKSEYEETHGPFDLCQYSPTKGPSL